ncbi:MAG: hypothetical protein ABL998_22460 [Planctomycetota bacterium]
MLVEHDPGDLARRPQEEHPKLQRARKSIRDPDSASRPTGSAHEELRGRLGVPTAFRDPPQDLARRVLANDELSIDAPPRVADRDHLIGE